MVGQPVTVFFINVVGADGKTKYAMPHATADCQTVEGYETVKVVWPVHVKNQHSERTLAAVLRHHVPKGWALAWWEHRQEGVLYMGIFPAPHVDGEPAGGGENLAL